MSETNEYHLCPADRVIFVAASGRDIFRALLNGACVYPFDVKRDGLAQLAGWLLREEITVFSGVVSLFRHFVATLDGTEKFPDLRMIKLIGEPVHRQDVDLYRKYFSDDCILINSYGPNEAGHVAHYFIDKETNFVGNSVPVGYTIAGKDVLLLDGAGREVDTGTVAEIVVRSRYLSPGYWRRTDLTEAKFRPVHIDGPERLYFTGDLGVRNTDGCLTVTGREDFQVKIRGNRVEIAEIERALLDLESVKEAVVVTRENTSGDKQLIAYFVAKTQTVPTGTFLRKRLAEKLPEYMVPSVFVSLDALPMIGIGKVNRQALPDPGYSRPELDTPFAAPRNRVEEVLAEIWAEVLSIDKVGIHDNFFELGGHSLTATRIITKVIGHFNREISLRRLFESPTVAEMAAVVADDQGKQLSGDELENILSEIEALSPEETQRLMSEPAPKNSKT